MSSLPPGWTRTALADLGTWYGGGTPSKSKSEYWTDGTVPWLSPKDMGPDTLVDTKDHITEDAVEMSAARLVPAGSVALVVRSGILERTVPIALVPFETTLNQDMKALAPEPDIDPRWVAWGLRSVERHLLDQCRKAGTTVASLDTRQVMATVLPVPPLAEQQRILTILEDHLSRLDAALASLSSADRRQSSLAEVVVRAELLGWTSSTPRAESRLADVGLNDGDLQALPAGWEWKRLGDLADVVGGVTKDSKRQADPGYVEVPYLRVANVQRGRLDLGRVITIRVPPSKAADLELVPGDVLLNEGGDRDKLGRGWIWEGQIPNCIHQNHVFRARVRDAAIEPRLLSWAANVLGGPWCDRNAAQSVNLASISLTKIRQMPVPVPPPDSQAPIVQRISGHLDSLARQRAEIANLSHRTQSLRRALLEAAFTGALTARPANATSGREAVGV